MATFTARYWSLCPACDNGVHSGMEVTYSADHKLIHVECDSDAVIGETRKACPECWLVPPCDCGSGA